MSPFRWKPSWDNILLIYQRELRDQLRDRRTLFTIVVLPMLLYPLLAMTVFQIQQFRHERPSRIRLIGVDSLEGMPVLVNSTSDDEEADADVDSAAASVRFADTVCPPTQAHLYKLDKAEASLESMDAEALRSAMQAEIESGAIDAAIFFPPEFSTQWQASLKAVASAGTSPEPIDPEQDALPQPQIFVNRAMERSQIAAQRIGWVLDEWRQKLVIESLRNSNLPESTIHPFEVNTLELADAGRPRAAIWSKVLPLVLLIWALTGAFYPAVDLCAGEKERGTLETLLSSPALRDEIVWGKLLTVMTFSMATSLLNLLGMGMTGTFIMKQMQNMAAQPLPIEVGPPPLLAVIWLVVALLPISAMFSALALAIATFARSSKEGQYYLMPLLMISLPLMMLPIMPSTQLDLGTALIPLSGLMLLLRSLIEGQYSEAAKYVLFVAAVTCTCCWISIRWAIKQFQSESVLFRESERFQVGLWLRHLLRDREDMPSVGEGVFCGVLILILRFFMNFMIHPPTDWKGMVLVNMAVQLSVIALPAVLMAVMLTRRPLQALSLRSPSFWITIPAAILLAALFQPALTWLAMGISHLYPPGEQMAQQIKMLTKQFEAMPLGVAILMLGVTPAICEELAFRGFLLSGLRRMGNKWGAIILASAFFGIAHGILQQSLGAFVVGIVIGYVAVKTGSLFPAMLYHFTHNTMAVLLGLVDQDLVSAQPWLKLVFLEVKHGGETGFVYQPIFAAVAAALGVGLLFWFKSLRYHRSDEELLQSVMDRPTSVGSPSSMAS